MKQIRTLLTLVGALALMAASLVGGGVSAADIETTLTVDNTAACVPTTPSTVGIIPFPNQDFEFGSGTSQWPGNLALPNSASIQARIHWNVSDCNITGVSGTIPIGNEWNVYMSFTDFSSGSHTIPATIIHYIANTVGNNGGVKLGLDGAGNAGAATTTSYLLTGTGAGPYLQYPGAGTDFRVANGIRYNATGFNNQIVLRISGEPQTTPPGVYTTTMTLTLTVNQP